MAFLKLRPLSEGSEKMAYFILHLNIQVRMKLTFFAISCRPQLGVIKYSTSQRLQPRWPSPKLVLATIQKGHFYFERNLHDRYSFSFFLEILRSTSINESLTATSMRSSTVQ